MHVRVTICLQSVLRPTPSPWQGPISTENGLVNKDAVAGGRMDKLKQIRITQRLGNRPYAGL